MRVCVGLLVAVVALAGRGVEASPPRAPCIIKSTMPRDGSTAVSARAPVCYQLGGECYGEERLPELLDEAGNSVAYSLTRGVEDDLCFAPSQPLTQGWYTVRFGRPVGPIQTCLGTKRETKEIRFRVGAEPRLVSVDFVNVESAVHGLTISLSEAVAAGVAAKDYIHVTGPEPSDVQFTDRQTVFWSFKGLAAEQQPRTSSQFVVSIKKELPFTTGASLAKDEEVTLIPAEHAYGWKPGTSPCRVETSGGCSAAGGGLVPMVALAALGLGFRRRRAAR